MKYHESGREDHAKILEEMHKTPTRASKIRNTWRLASISSSVRRRYDEEEALALFLEADFTMHQYNMMRRGAKDRNADIYPSYKRILNEKKRCYPESVSVTEFLAEVKFQDLLNHTVSQILMS
ncbi:hypothetical protein ANN_19219 [Periplaneta americana]|uniref:Per a allergen n=1 Tax=Periplaneta americana TaxID=6978 RepID=A0ABQ8S9H0_PERAM|nr:hypothetical protein ANN_19219 [Periplaneta americana]